MHIVLGGASRHSQPSYMALDHGTKLTKIFCNVLSNFSTLYWALSAHHYSQLHVAIGLQVGHTCIGLQVGHTCTGLQVGHTCQED